MLLLITVASFSCSDDDPAPATPTFESFNYHSTFFTTDYRVTDCLTTDIFVFEEGSRSFLSAERPEFFVVDVPELTLFSSGVINHSGLVFNFEISVIFDTETENMELFDIKLFNGDFEMTVDLINDDLRVNKRSPGGIYACGPITFTSTQDGWLISGNGVSEGGIAFKVAFDIRA